jgi:uncharacterized Zn finger protein
MAWSYGRFPEYVPVAQRRATALAQARKLEKRSGRKLDPVVLGGKQIAKSFWGKSWCDNIERYSDFRNRLPRGRTYLRSGAIVDLVVSEGRVEALVAGSSLYQCKVELAPLARGRWKKLGALCAGQIDSVVDLLQGRLPAHLLEAMVDAKAGLFPAPRDLRMSCSCPDSADLCKHLAAVLYAIGARVDRSPELFFTLRSVKMEDLVARAARPEAIEKGLGDEALEAIFGIEIEKGAPPRRKRR